MNSPTPTSTRFYPKSWRERLEWVAARQKERYSQHPSRANFTDRDWIALVPPGSDYWLTVPVLDPSCKVTMAPDQDIQSVIDRRSRPQLRKPRTRS